MAYISQIIVFVLAVMGILFKSTKTDPDGKPVYWKYNIPELTHTGKVVLVLVTLSTIISVVAAHSKSVADEKERGVAKAKQEKTEAQLNNVEQQNQALRDVLSDVYKQSRFISEEQEKQFRAVLTEQKQTGEGIANRIGATADVLGGRLDNSIDLLHRSTNEIGRAVNPINNIQVSFSLSVPKDNPNLIKYQQLLEKTFPAVPDKLPTGVYAATTYKDEEVTKLGITAESEVFPTGLAYYALNFMRLKIEFYKPALPANVLRADAGNPDFRIFTIGSVNGVHSEPKIGLIYNLKQRQLFIRGYFLQSEPRFWYSGSDRITSIPDILSSQLVVRVSTAVFPSDENEGKALTALQGRFELDSLTIQISGRVFNFESGQCKRFTDYDDHYFYVCGFSQQP